jgi:hypothetical protein
VKEALPYHHGHGASADFDFATARKWVIYSTFDSAGAPASHVVEQLQAYRDIGFNVLVVDTSETLSSEREHDWWRLSTLWLRRPNAGYDFGSYQKGIDVLINTLGIPVDELSLLLTNDSCFGPYTSLAETFRRFDAMSTDTPRMFGITDSQQRGVHLQSYWLYVRPDASRIAVGFFDAMPLIADREDAIARGELGLSAHMRKAGVQLVALCPERDMVAHFAKFRNKPVALLELGIRRLLKKPRYSRNGDGACFRQLIGRHYQVNSTAAFGTHMHFQGLSPFLKRQLIRENPNADPFVPPLADFPAFDNASVARVLRSTAEYQRRYGNP